MSEEKGEGYLDVGGSESEEVRLAATLLEARCCLLQLPICRHVSRYTSAHDITAPLFNHSCEE